MSATVADCDVCRAQAQAQTDDALAADQLLAFRKVRWIVRHHPHPAPLAGWFFLCTVRHVQGPADMDSAEAAELGPMIQHVSRAVRAATDCDRVYSIAFGQGAPHFHAHIVPRNDADERTRAWAVADHYRAVEAGRTAPADPEAVTRVVNLVRKELCQ